jgi:rod shape-determining protein MreC
VSPLRDSEAKPLFQQTASPGLRLIILLLVSVTLMTLDHRYSHLDSLRHALSVLVHPVRLLVDLPIRVSRALSASLTERVQLLEDNAELRDQHLLDAQNLQRMAALEAENARLRALFESSAPVADRALVASILSVDLDPFRHRIVLSRGTREGVFLGQPLIDDSGVLGQVDHLGYIAAEALLITDPDHAIPVVVNRNGLRTIAVGTGEIDRLDLPFLTNSADLREGDLLVTSGLGGVFPAGYPVAVITRVSRDPGRRFATISARPTAALDRVREVLLLFPEEASALPAGGDD